MCCSTKNKLEIRNSLPKPDARIARTPCASYEYWDMCLTASGLGYPDDIIQLKHTGDGNIIMDGEMLNKDQIKIHAVTPYKDNTDILSVCYIHFDSIIIINLKKIVFNKSDSQIL